ncbi:MAG: hypothetical protein WCT07_00105 [Candidatus Paceibacterota bacterium]|jgi:hypothetical protein
MQTNANKVGLVGGALLGGWHLLWSVLVFLGVGQTLIDFVLWMHMIHLPYVVGPFELTAALTLIVMTTILGYCIGYTISLVWNKIHTEAHAM